MIARALQASRWLSTHPATCFFFLSLAFGPLTILLTPPFRGPDEPSHFVRAYAIATGELLPPRVQVDGKKGILLPAQLDYEMQLYAAALGARYGADAVTYTYPNALAHYRRELASAPAPVSTTEAFAAYEGAAAYSPAPYLAYVPGFLIAKLFNVDFVGTIYLARGAGFVLLTGLVAAAIRLAPALSWTFVMIGLLPAALFSRSVLSADSSALAFTMLVVALTLRSTQGLGTRSPLIRSLWMTLCVLCKPPQLAFILLEFTRTPLKPVWLHWRSVSVVLVPAVVLATGWVVSSWADVAAWQAAESTGRSVESPTALSKLLFILEEPGHFAALLAGTITHSSDYWRQLIGVLGWLDAPLRSWSYPVLSLLAVGAFFTSAPLQEVARRRIAWTAGVTVVAYVIGVFLIFYLIWTPLDHTSIESVQGRYFLVVLPLVALVVAARLRRGLTAPRQAQIVIAGSLLGGWLVVDAVLRSDWKMTLLPF